MNWLSWAGRTVTGRRAERQTITFTELVRRAEVRLPAARSRSPLPTARRGCTARSAGRQLIAHSGVSRVRIRRD